MKGEDPTIHEELESGLTWRSILTTVLAILAFIPVSTYMYLVVGTALGNVSILFITLLFAELSRLSYARLRSQEVFMVYFGAGWGGASILIYYTLVFRHYFIHSPFAWSVNIDGKPLPYMVPDWMVPSYGSPTLLHRTFFQQEWLLPVFLTILWAFLTLVANLSLSMLIAQAYVEVEKMPFPFAEVETSLVRFLSERPPEITKIFVYSMIPGIIWASLAYSGHILMGLTIIPIPYLDLVWLVQDILPGAALGISTLLSSYVGGFMVPFNSALTILLASIIINIIFNSLFITTFPDVFPEWPKEYIKGMGLIAVQNRSLVRVWLAPYIGFSFAAAIFTLYKARRGMLTVLKAIFTRSSGFKSTLGFPSQKLLILLYLMVTSTSVIIYHLLVPEIPIFIPIFTSIIYSFLMGVVFAAMQGETGYIVPLDPGNVWLTLVYLTPYKGYAGFAFTPIIAGNQPPTFCQRVKVALATRTKPIDLVKMNLLAWSLAWIVGLLSLDILWRMAPIPSSAYPFTVYNMPQMAQVQVQIVSRGLRITLPYVLYPMLGATAASFLIDVLAKLGLPLSPIGFFIGLHSPTTFSIPLFIGSSLSTFVMPRLFGGKERWMRLRSSVVAGESLGEGMVLIILLAISLISRSSWLKPW